MRRSVVAPIDTVGDDGDALDVAPSRQKPGCRPPEDVLLSWNFGGGPPVQTACGYVPY